MSIEMERAADAILQAAHAASLVELSDGEVDPDGSSSLSEIQDQDGDEAEASDDLSNLSDQDNDSEAETERLEESPNKFRPPQDVLLSSVNQTYQPSPSKLHNEITLDDPEDDDDEDPLPENLSINESPDSPKSSPPPAPEDPPLAAAAFIESPANERTQLPTVSDTETKKRKRSVLADGLDEDPSEPLHKRTGSVMIPGDEVAIEDDNSQLEPGEASKIISGDISLDNGGATPAVLPTAEVEEPTTAEVVPPETPNIPASPKRRGRKKKKVVENGIVNHDEVPEVPAEVEVGLNGGSELKNGEEDHADNEGDDEAEAALRNEEELERKRVALDQLGDIERQFTTFRERLYEERLEQLNREEAMLRQDNPTHPEYLTMMQCIDAKRDERIRVAENLQQYELQCLRNYAVARRSQILTQFQQEVRDIREKKLELLGKKWYEIQHDRRSYAGSVPDYTLKFPTRKSQQIANQVAYSTEVSILSGVAKYVGFPAAPPMAPATAAELDDDLERMGRSRQVPIHSAQLPLQELAALRAVGSASRFKPAEEQFIEQTPWANPQHPSHAHLLQRQTSAQQTARTTSPFSQVQAQPRRHSHQTSLPISGTFSSAGLNQQPNGVSMPQGRMSPHNIPFTNSNLSHAAAPSLLGSRNPSLSPDQARQPLPEKQYNSSNIKQEMPKSNGNQRSPSINLVEGFSHEVRRDVAAIMTRF